MRTLVIMLAMLVTTVAVRADEVLFAGSEEMAAFDTLVGTQAAFQQPPSVAKSEEANEDSQEEEETTSSEPTGPVKIARTPVQYQ